MQKKRVPVNSVTVIDFFISPRSGLPRSWRRDLLLARAIVANKGTSRVKFA